MAKRLGVFVDVSNLYYCVGKKFENRKLNYTKYKEYIAGMGEIVQAIAYGAQMENEAIKFIRVLSNLGFTTKFKAPQVYENAATGEGYKRKADWDVGIAMDIVTMADKLDIVILGSADGDLTPAVEWCRHKGIDVIVLACRISRSLKDNASKFIEIPESFLEEKRIITEA